MTEFEPVSFRRPLLDTWTATAVLNCTQEQVIMRIEEGQIEWAFNIANKGMKKCIRIFAPSLIDLAKNRPARGRTFAEVFEVIMPGKTEGVLLVNVARQFNCSAWHLIQLFQTEGIIQGPCKQRGESRRVLRRAVAEFLQGRRCS